MFNLIGRLVLAVIVAVVVGLVLVGLVGPFLLAIHAVPADILGSFCENFGWAIGILAGGWYFFTRGGLAL